MNPEALLCCLTCAAGVTLCLYGDAKERQRLLGTGKMLASLSFVSLALLSPQEGPFGSAYRLWVSLALGASLVGDACLIWRSERAFLGGLAAFLLAHLLFGAAAIGASAELGLFTAAGTGGALTVGGLILWWLKPSIPEPLWWPSVVYMIVIGGMVGACLQLSIERGAPLVGLAALGFWLSDLSVARDRFLDVGLRTRLWGIPLYFISQLLFGLSLYPALA